MASIDTLAAAIREALTQAHNLASRIAASKNLGEELRDQLAELGTEGKAAQTSAIISGFEENQARANNITTQLEATLAATEAMRTDQTQSGSESSPRHPAPPNPEPPWRQRPPIPGFTHRRPVAECVEAVRREGWPRNAQGKISARGHLYTDDGRQVNTESFRPHRKGSAPPCEDLREPWRSDEHYTTTWHAERDAAALIRKWGLTDPVLYLNLPPCGRRSQDRQRCHANLESILPAGATLYVWEIGENGAMNRYIYRGNGKALA